MDRAAKSSLSHNAPRHQGNKKKRQKGDSPGDKEADVAKSSQSTKPGRQNGTQARWQLQPRTNDSYEGKTEPDKRPGEGSVVVSLLG